ncbi:MAG: hypothetical protein FJ095_01425 [Deltaproteobacteria bacterium]|nr:hypothetical protein [Deltaproteobacteria bacterium]
MRGRDRRAWFGVARACLRFGALGAVAYVGCALPEATLVDRPSLAGTGGVGGTGGAGGAGGVGGQGGTGGGSCVSARWPGAPAADDPSIGSDLDLVFAVRTIDIGESQTDLNSVGPKVGYDLDGVCTGLGDPSSCLVPSGADPGDYKDGPGGIDNRTAKLFASAKTFNASFSSQNFSEGANDGSWSLLVRVSKYNGTKNDGKVTVALYPSPGIGDEACAPDDTKPLWNGSDAWPVDANALGKSNSGPGSDGGMGVCSKGVPGYSYDAPKYVDTNAYVADGIFVANLPGAALTVSNFKAGTLVKLTAGFITGTIVVGPNGYRISEGVFTGRWTATDMFLAFSTGLSEGQALCTTNPVYQLIRTAVCSARDIAGSLGGPTTPCDAVSFALRFEAEPAKLGAVLEVPLPMSGCTKDTNPAFDMCP